MAHAPRCGLVGAELAPGGHRWSAGVLAGDERIYMVPLHGSDRVLCFDPRTGAGEHVGPGFEGGDKWRGGVLGPDGVVYGVPWSSARFLAVDPAAQPVSVETVGPDLNELLVS